MDWLSDRIRDAAEWLDDHADLSGTVTIGGGETETTISVGDRPGPRWETVVLALLILLVLILWANG